VRTETQKLKEELVSNNKEFQRAGKDAIDKYIQINDPNRKTQNITMQSTNLYKFQIDGIKKNSKILAREKKNCTSR